MARTQQAKGKTAPRGRRGGRPWTTDEQLVFLQEQAPSYHASSQTHSQAVMKKFWAALNEEFFRRWPISADLGVEAREAAVKKQKERLKQWYNNHSRASTNGGSSSRKVLNLTGKKKKRLSQVQAYSALYYESKIKGIVEKRWTEREEYDPDEPEPHTMKFRNTVTKELWEDEKDEAVKARVLEYIEERYNRDPYASDSDEVSEEEEVDDEEKERRQAARAFYHRVECLPLTIARSLEQIQQETGYQGFMALIGPHPKKGGSLDVIIVHCGETEAGSKIFDYVPTLKATVNSSLKQYGEAAIPPAVRARHSLPGTEDKRDYQFNPKPDAPEVDLVAREQHQNRVSELMKRTMQKVDAARMDVDDEDVDMAGGDADDVAATKGGRDHTQVSETSSQSEAGDTPLEPSMQSKQAHKKVVVEPWPEAAGDYLRGFSGHALWSDVIDTFIAYEAHVSATAGKARLSALPAAKRPLVLSEWIRAGRKPDKHQILDNEGVEKLTVELYQWWYSVQPHSRIPVDAKADNLDCSGLSRNVEGLDDDSWAELDKGTANGIFGVLTCLAWWLEATKGSPGEAFDLLIDDVLWVLRHLLTLKRPAPTDTSTSKPRSTSSVKPRSRRR